MTRSLRFEVVSELFDSFCVSKQDLSMYTTYSLSNCNKIYCSNELLSDDSKKKQAAYTVYLPVDCSCCPIVSSLFKVWYMY